MQEIKDGLCRDNQETRQGQKEKSSLVPGEILLKTRTPWGGMGGMGQYRMAGQPHPAEVCYSVPGAC